MSEVVWIATN